MAGGYPIPPRDGLDALVQQIRKILTRLDELERPTGTQLYNSVAKLTQLVNDLPGEITAAIGAFLTTDGLHVTGASALDGTVTAGGDVDADGSVTAASVTAASVTAASVVASGDVRGSDLYSANAATFNITGTRAGGWWETATGRAGTAVSSRRFKTNIEDANLIDRAPQILQLAIVHYQHIAEIAKRDDPTSANYVGPNYKVHTEIGQIAEDLHAAGLWEFVIYEREFVALPYEGAPVETLKLDENGEPIPRAIHYELFSLAVLAAAQYIWEKQIVIRSDLDRVLDHLGLERD